MQVVENEHERGAVCRSFEKTGDSIEQSAAHLRRLAGVQLGQVGQTPAQHGNDLRDLATVSAEQLAQLVVGQPARTLAQDLHPRPEGGSAFALVAATPQNARTGLLGVQRQLLRRACLADPRLAAEQDQAAAARGRVGQRSSQCRQLALASDEDSAARR